MAHTVNKQSSRTVRPLAFLNLAMLFIQFVGEKIFFCVCGFAVVSESLLETGVCQLCLKEGVDGVVGLAGDK